MIDEIILISVLILLNILFFRLFIKIYNKLKIYDEPDFTRKFHKFNVPLVGGVIFIINIIMYFSYILLTNDLNHFFLGSREVFAFLTGSILIFFIGLYDDRFSIKPNTKLFLIFLVGIITISVSETFKLDHISFLFYEKNIFLNDFGKIFTVFCILVFLNAFNMIDGINGLSVSYFIICLVYILFFNYNFLFFLFLLIPSIIFLFYNFQNKVFLGDSGSLLLGFILSCLFIKSYNENLIFADQIILIMIIPGIDMLRVAIIRILKKKHPFAPDRTHIHHLLLNKYNQKFSLISLIFLIFVTALFSIILEYKYINLIQIFIVLLIYFVFIKYHKLK